VIDLPSRRTSSLFSLLVLAALALSGCGSVAPASQVAAQPVLLGATPIPTPVVAVGALGSCYGEATQLAAVNAWATQFQVAFGLVLNTRADLDRLARDSRSGLSLGDDLSTARSDQRNAAAAVAALRAPAAYRQLQTAIAGVVRGYGHLLRTPLANLSRRGQNDAVLNTARRALSRRSAALARVAPRLAHCTIHRLREVSAHATATAVARRQARIAATATAVARIAAAHATATAVIVQQNDRIHVYTARLQNNVTPHLLGASLDLGLAAGFASHHQDTQVRARLKLAESEIDTLQHDLATTAPSTSLAAVRTQLLGALADLQTAAADIHAAHGKARTAELRQGQVALQSGRTAMADGMARVGVHLIFPS